LVLANCILEALTHNIALPTNGLGRFNLLEGWTCIANREEEFGVFVQASSLIQPLHVHIFGFPRFWECPSCGFGLGLLRKCFHTDTQKAIPRLKNSPAALRISVLIVAAQAALIWLAAIWGGLQVAGGNFERMLPALLLLAIAVGFAAWATMIALRLSQLRAWAYTAALVLEATLGSVGVASFLGEFASPPIAAALLVPAGVAILLLSRREVRALYPQRRFGG